ncbi:CcmD family protein [Neolewinella lacunae]|uniref:CcmD family protein n=1 Tax=Neolewinella lacunae TaxID=1517758 RepID=A0A923TBW2_9BACT|nr:CcmD family protein [Neolewinella lacunae]MBC6993057.1 CcmD family protein [Neolewinella lacunae]MDN3635879.1 CcmD family protein [Neolewinella lacunae]
MTRFTTTFLLLAFSLGSLLAQSAAEPPADFLRSIGKIYVVVAVIVVVFLGLVFYLWSLDRKLTVLEKQIEDHV